LPVNFTNSVWFTQLRQALATNFKMRKLSLKD
jgi:hypothetical protein